MPVSSKRRSARKRSRSIRGLSKESLSTVGKKHENLTECTSYEVESVEPTRQKIRRKDQHDYNDDSLQQQQQHDHCVPQKEHRIKETISSLQLDNSQQQQAVSTFQILDVLPECMIGACFFEGYLDSMEIITSLSLVSKGMRQIGRETVKSLDLRKCTKLCPDDLKTLVNTFYNLTVRFLSIFFNPHFVLSTHVSNHYLLLLGYERTLILVIHDNFQMII